MSEWSVCAVFCHSDHSRRHASVRRQTRRESRDARVESRESSRVVESRESDPSCFRGDVVVCRPSSSWCKKCARHDDGVGDGGDEGRGAVASASVRWRRMRVGVVVVFVIVAAVCRARARE